MNSAAQTGSRALQRARFVRPGQPLKDIRQTLALAHVLAQKARQEGRQSAKGGFVHFHFPRVSLGWRLFTCHDRRQMS